MGANALILRDAARAAATVREFTRLGITSRCAQLIAAIWPEDTAELEAACQRLRAGAFDWLVVTSANTVYVLAQLLDCRQLGPELKLAVVGTKTAQVAKELLGLDPAFRPRVQSAEGMLAGWRPEAGAKIFYPHGDLASTTLAQGLAEQQVFVTEAVAYRTVHAPAAREVHRRPAPEGIQSIAPEQIPAVLGELDLIVFTAPSIARRFVQLAGASLPPQCRTIAIGQPTAAALRALALPVHAVAEDPGPRGIAAAAAKLLRASN
ncbi:uroporphyrinogen-III synthase [Glutamicibacter sp.]|uniref:uroporphyrinogen-III synthase n=1 Tax=Glutamicibacter sp. TaxID=1931995 RepID=UPI0028BE1B48|nr:uroporphyrinogen-III synthase [Glutamicibacter sp.]